MNIDTYIVQPILAKVIDDDIVMVTEVVSGIVLYECVVLNNEDDNNEDDNNKDDNNEDDNNEDDNKYL